MKTENTLSKKALPVLSLEEQALVSGGPKGSGQGSQKSGCTSNTFNRGGKC